MRERETKTEKKQAEGGVWRGEVLDFVGAGGGVAGVFGADVDFAVFEEADVEGDDGDAGEAGGEGGGPDALAGVVKICGYSDGDEWQVAGDGRGAEGGDLQDGRGAVAARIETLSERRKRRRRREVGSGESGVGGGWEISRHSSSVTFPLVVRSILSRARVVAR